MRLIGGEAVDVDGDGVLDAVLRNDPCADGEPCDQADQGFFVLLGKPGRGLAGYYTFTRTPDTRPFTVHIRDLDGDGDEDALVYGLNASADAGLLAFHEALAPASFAQAQTLVLETTQLPVLSEEQPNRIVDIELDQDDDPDLVVSRWGQIFTLEVTKLGTAFEENEPTQILPTDTRAIAMKAVPSAQQGYDDLLIDTNDGLMWLASDGAGGFEDPVVNAGDPGDMYTYNYDSFFVDMNDDGRPDMLGSGPDVVRTATTGGVDESYRYNGAQSRDGVPMVFAQVSLDGDPRPDAVALRRSGVCSTTEDCSYHIDVYVDLSIGSSDLEDTTTTPVQWTVEGTEYSPVVGVIGDFDDSGDVEVIMFDAAGQRRCVRITDSSAGDVSC